MCNSRSGHRTGLHPHGAGLTVTLVSIVLIVLRAAILVASGLRRNPGIRVIAIGADESIRRRLKKSHACRLWRALRTVGGLPGVPAAALIRISTLGR